MNINLDIFKRNIKLQELGIGKLSPKEQKLLDFFNEHLNNLNTYTSDKYIGYLFLGKDRDNIILQCFERAEFLYIPSSNMLTSFESEFNVEKSDTRKLIQWWCVDTLHLKVTKTLVIFGHRLDKVDILDLKLT